MTGDDLRPVVMSLARGIAENAPLTIAAAKAGLRDAQPEGQRDLATVNQVVEACFRSADYLEGQRAFTEKRPRNLPAANLNKPLPKVEDQ